MPGLIVGVPSLLVLKQPDLGSAIVFHRGRLAMLVLARAFGPGCVHIESPGARRLLALKQLGVGPREWWRSRRCSSPGARTSMTRCGLVS